MGDLRLLLTISNEIFSSRLHSSIFCFIFSDFVSIFLLSRSGFLSILEPVSFVESVAKVADGQRQAFFSTEHERMSNYTTEFQHLKGLKEFPFKFVSGQSSADAVLTCDDEDLNAWEVEAERWARVLFTVANIGEDVALPGTVRGKLGGPRQCRLASVTTTAVLQAELKLA
ncbi:hypothetical protein LINPERHAP1_LOCUS16271 [Linum perenne]